MPLDIDRYAHVASPVQRWDARYKIVALGVFMFGVALLETLPMAILALFVTLGLIAVAGLPGRFILQGVSWVALFLVPFFLVLPFSHPAPPAFHVLGLPFAWEGFRLAVLIVCKALAVVITAYALFGSSRFDVSMIALQRLKVPKVLVQMLLFTYRYIFVFVSELRRMEVAMRARGFVKRFDGHTLRVMGNFVGTLLVRSLERTERIYKAMLSKGYQGELHSFVVFRASPKDAAKALVVIIAIALILWGDSSHVFAPAERGWIWPSSASPESL